MHIQATWNNTIIASTDTFKIVEGRYYFPPESVIMEYVHKNGEQHIGRWKGIADYYDIIVNDKTYKNGALVFTNPEKEVSDIQGYFSFLDDVDVVQLPHGLEKDGI